MRLIDADALKAVLRKRSNALWRNSQMSEGREADFAFWRKAGIADALAELERMPEIREEPVRRGEWLSVHTDVRCSECKLQFDYEVVILITERLGMEYPYGAIFRCPKCGSYNKYGG